MHVYKVSRCEHGKWEQENWFRSRLHSLTQSHCFYPLSFNVLIYETEVMFPGLCVDAQHYVGKGTMSTTKINGKWHSVYIPCFL